MSLWFYSMVITWVFLAAILFMVDTTECKNCGFKAIFNFGDSNTDTGGFWAAFPAQGPPHGMTYFKKPVGRATDGRVILDFLGRIYDSSPIKFLKFNLTDLFFLFILD